LPVVLLVLLGVFDLGRLIFAYNEIANAAREGARLAIVNQDVASVRARAVGQAVALDIQPANVAVAFKDPGPDPDAEPVCSPMAVGCVAVVTVPYTFRAITPVIGNLVGPVALSATTTFTIEYVCGVAGADIVNPTNCPRQP
jgi:hypothetical protein